MTSSIVREKGYLVRIDYVYTPYVLIASRINKENDESSLLQIGLSGILPISLQNNKIVGNVSNHWSPGSIKILEHCISKAVEIYFIPSLNANIYHVFRDVPYMFGKLYLLQNNENVQEMSNILCENRLAYTNEEEYTQAYLKKNLINMSKVEIEMITMEMPHLKHMVLDDSYENSKIGENRDQNQSRRPIENSSLQTEQDSVIDDLSKRSNNNILLFDSAGNFLQYKPTTSHNENKKTEKPDRNNLLVNKSKVRNESDSSYKSTKSRNNYIYKKPSNFNREEISFNRSIVKNNKSPNNRILEKSKYSNSEISDSFEKKNSLMIDKQISEINGLQQKNNTEHVYKSKKSRKFVKSDGLLSDGVNSELVGDYVSAVNERSLSQNIDDVEEKYLKDEASFDSSFAFAHELAKKERVNSTNSKTKSFENSLDTSSNSELKDKSVNDLNITNLTSSNVSASCDTDDPELSLSDEENVQIESSFDKFYFTNVYISGLQKKSKSNLIKDVGCLGGNISIDEITEKSKNNINANVEKYFNIETKKDFNENSIDEYEYFKEDVLSSSLNDKLINIQNTINDDYDFVDQIFIPKLMIHTKYKINFNYWLEYSDVRFTQWIMDNLLSMKIEKIAPLQTAVWPAVTNGFNTQIVGPKNSGKSLSLLAPLCDFVSKMSNVINLPYSYGPIIWIICPNQNSIDKIENMCKQLLKNIKIANVDESIVKIDNTTKYTDICSKIFNNCAILISTPILSKYIDDKCFKLDRLSFVVFNNVDVLINTFDNKLVRIYKKLLDINSKKSYNARDIQILSTSRTWCSFLYYMGTTLKNPMICINNFLECLKYSYDTNVKTVLIKVDDKLDELVKQLKGVMQRYHKVVVFCNSYEEIQSVAKKLKNCTYNIIKTMNSMNFDQILNIKDEWQSTQNFNSKTVLICCDNNYGLLNIWDADYLIHYSLPVSFSSYNNRFRVIVDNIALMWKTKSVCRAGVMIFVDETNSLQLPKIVNFLEECEFNVSDEIKNYSQHISVQKDIVKAKNSVKLCDELCYFGKCSNINNCVNRHTFFAEYDKIESRLPKSGYIDFKVVYIHSVCHYTIRLLSHTDVDGKITKFAQTNLDMQMQMYSHYMDRNNRIPLNNPKPRDKCVVEMEFITYLRCEIIEIYKKKDDDNFTSALIELIDLSKCIVCDTRKLFVLNDRFTKIDENVVDVIMTGLIPNKEIGEWNSYSRNGIQRIYLDYGKDTFFRGRIVSGVKKTYWIDDVDCCERLKSVDKIVVMENIKSLIVKKNIGIENDAHLPSLYELCKKGMIDIPSYESPKIEKFNNRIELPEPQWAFLDEDDFCDVYFTFGKNPGLFFLRIVKFQKCLDMLQKDIEKFVDHLRNNTSHVKEPEINQYYLARHTDGCFYRSRIDNIINNEDSEAEYDCFFVDYGDSGIVKATDIYSISPELIIQMPFQTIECRLLGIKPISDEWSETSLDYLYDSCFEPGDDNISKVLCCKNVLQEKPTITNGKRYVVLIHDSLSGTDETLNESFISQKYADVLDAESDLILETKEKIKNHQCSLMQSLDNESEFEDIEFDIAETTDTMLDDGTHPCFDVDITDFDIDNEFSDNDDADDEWDCNFTINDFYNKMEESGNGDEGLLMAMKNALLKSEDKKVRVVEVPNDTDVKNLDKYFPKIRKPDNRTDSVIDTLDVYKNRVSENDSLYKKPFVRWYETVSYVFLKIDLIGVEEYELKIGPSDVLFDCIHNDDHYKLDIELKGCVMVDQCSHTSFGLYISVKLKKRREKKWLCLLRSNEKATWLKRDHDNCDEADYIEDIEGNQEEAKEQMGEMIEKGYFDDDGSDSENSIGDISDDDSDTLLP